MGFSENWRARQQLDFTHNSVLQRTIAFDAKGVADVVPGIPLTIKIANWSR